MIPRQIEIMRCKLHQQDRRSENPNGKDQIHHPRALRPEPTAGLSRMNVKPQGQGHKVTWEAYGVPSTQLGFNMHSAKEEYYASTIYLFSPASSPRQWLAAI
jgi:hypothetical protein